MDLVLDVGASVGQYGIELREAGYPGRIWSFEPLPESFDRLRAASEHDDLWRCSNLAVGDHEGHAELWIAGNSVSSSVLPMLERHVQALPEAAYVAKRRVAMISLDSIRAEIDSLGGAVWLKLDVQGYETQVLEGAAELLPQLAGLEMELSLVPLYEGQSLFDEMIDVLKGQGLRLVSLEPGFVDYDTGHTLQVDGIFIRESGRDL